MAIKLKNNALTTLALGMNTTDIQLKVSDPSVFPSLASGDWFYATIISQVDDTL